MIVEYKKHLVNGAIVDPEWIIKGSYFKDTVNNTWIGLCLEESERDYYIPDSVEILDRAGLIERAKNIHAQNPYIIWTDPNDFTTERERTLLELEEMIDEFINLVVEPE